MTTPGALAKPTIRSRLAHRIAKPEIDALESALRVERGRADTAERSHREYVAGHVFASSAEAQADKIARKIERAWFREDCPRDADGRPLSIPVHVTRKGDVRLRASSITGKPPAYLAGALVWDSPEARQGWPGLDFTGALPNAESRKDSKPYKLRGLGISHGSAFNMYRGDPAVSDSIDTRVNFLMAGCAEFGIPEAIGALPPETIARLGIDLDAIARHADELNSEMAINPAIKDRAYLGEMYRLGHIAGFCLHEFSIDPTAADGRRIVFVEARHPSSVQFWVLDHLGHVVGFTQVAPGERGDGGTVPVVDIRRCMHFANKGDAGNPEGLSMVRPAWFWHTFGTEFAQSAMLHRQRFGPGVPIFERLPVGEGGGEEISETINEAAKNFYYAADAFMSVPKGVIVKLLQVQAEAGLDAVLRFVNEQKRTALGADVLALGNNGVGAYNLGDVKSQMLLRSLQGFARGPEEAHDSLAKAYVDAVHGEQMVYPQMRIRGILDRSPGEVITIADGVYRIERENTDMPLPERNDLRRRAGLPLIAEDDPRAEKAKDVRELSGVLVQNIAAIVEKVQLGAIPEDAATDLLVTAGIDREIAERMTAAAAAGIPVETRAVSLRRALAPVQTLAGPMLLRRDLSLLEGTVDLRAVAETMDSSRDKALAVVRQVAVTHRRRWIKAARQAIRDGDLAALARLSVDMSDQYEQGLLAVLRDASETAGDQMRQEIRRQVGRRKPAAPQPVPGAGLQTVIDAAAAAAAVKVNALFNQRLRDVGQQVAQGADPSLLSDAEPAPIYASNAAAGSVLMVMAKTREHVALREGPRVVSAMRSEVLDENTCSPCAQIDEGEVPFPSPEYDRIGQQYVLCDSTKGGENMCRGLWLYVFEDTRPELLA